MNNIVTKHDEVIQTVKTARELQGQYVSQTVKKTWVEDFVDQDTSEVVSVERNEVLMPKGTYLNPDKVSELMFLIQSGEINEVVVSNQKREAVLLTLKDYYIFQVVASVNRKSKKLLLYAQNLLMAYRVAVDFIELTYSEFFVINEIKDFAGYIMINKTLNQETDVEEPENPIAPKFYKMEVIVQTPEIEYSQKFIIQGQNTEIGKILIEDYIRNLDNEDTKEFSIMIETVSTIVCHHMVCKGFSDAYKEQ